MRQISWIRHSARRIGHAEGEEPPGTAEQRRRKSPAPATMPGSRHRPGAVTLETPRLQPRPDSERQLSLVPVIHRLLAKICLMLRMPGLLKMPRTLLASP